MTVGIAVVNLVAVASMGYWMALISPSLHDGDLVHRCLEAAPGLEPAPGLDGVSDGPDIPRILLQIETARRCSSVRRPAERDNEAGTYSFSAI